jgi:hypothetical protein
VNHERDPLIAKTIFATLLAAAILAPSMAQAGKFSSKSKVTNCSSYTNYFGTKTVCRTR